MDSAAAPIANLLQAAAQPDAAPAAPTPTSDAIPCPISIIVRRPTSRVAPPKTDVERHHPRAVYHLP